MTDYIDGSLSAPPAPHFLFLHVNHLLSKQSVRPLACLLLFCFELFAAPPGDPLLQLLSLRFDFRFFTAIARALGCPIIVTSFLPRVTAV